MKNFRHFLVGGSTFLHRVVLQAFLNPYEFIYTAVCYKNI